MRIPSIYREIESKSKGMVGFMGLSLGKTLFNDKQTMGAYINFLHENFSEAYLLIGDAPKRYNIVALEGISEEEALQRIVKASRSMRLFLEKLACKYPEICVMDWQGAIDENYEYNLNVLLRNYNENQEFRKESDERVKEFLLIPSNKQKLDALGSTLEQGVRLASKYHLEELAMLLSFPIAIGEKVCEIYPGVNEVQEKLQSGEYGFCPELRINSQRLFMEVYYD